jgi:energy-coupling factor transporter ATP-binding protein EcfA2
MSTDDEDATMDASTGMVETLLTVDDPTPHSAPTAIEKANDVILRQMAESIRVAHEINPNSWAVLERRGSISLIVSRYIALTTVYRQTSKATIIVATAEIDPGVERDYSFYRSPGVMKPIPCTFFEISAERIIEALPRLRKAHLAAVEMAAREVRTRSARANEHRPDMLEKIESATGERLPRPAYTHDSLAAGISPSAFNAAMLWRLVRTIHIADSINPNAWAVTPLDGQPALHLGFTRAITIGPRGPFDLIVDPGILDEPKTAWLHALLRPYQPQSKLMARLTIPVDRVESVLSVVSESHERAVRVAIADTKTKAQGWNDHSENMRRQIEDACGQKLPMPAYVTATASLHPVEAFHEGFAAAGLFYTLDQIATFYTALQTKGFVVLSGISGTGKSKIAQHFVNMLPAEGRSRGEIVLNSTDLIPRVVQPTTINSGLVNFPRKLIERILFPEDSVKLKLRIDFNGYEQTCAFRIILRRNSVLYRLYFAGEMKKRIASLKLGTMLYFRPLMDDETAVLVGFSILMPEEVPASAAYSGSTLSRNNLFLSVRPDWRDSRALIGYQNPLLGEYEWTDFLRFILHAGENYRSSAPIAWFMILDEMNLAHVEYYFADLLSVLESGRDDEGWTREAIRIQRPEPIDEQDEDVPPAEIRLPPNLYIIGTVNMDETTHAFSPKVLDRAFTMELSEVDFSSYPITTSGGAGEPTRAERSALLSGFSRNGRFARIEKAEVRDVVAEYPKIRDWLQILNGLLEKARMNFGYRVFDEIAAFTGNGMRNFEDFELEQVFDRAVLMKVLPKFSGSAARLERPLLDLLAWCLDPGRLPQKEVRQVFDSLGDGGWSASTHPVLAEGMLFPITGKRVMRMLDTLAVEGFASFG